MTASASSAHAWLGIELASGGNGQAVLVMPTRDEMADGAVVHDGFVGLLADSAMAQAMSTVLPDGERRRIFDLKLNFIAAPRIREQLRAVAKVLHAGRRTGVAECRVQGEGGRLVATATATFSAQQPYLTA